MSSKRLKILAMILVALALGTILLAACSRPGIAGSNPGGGGTTETSTPSAGGGGGGGCATGTVHMGPSTFVQSCATVSKGSKLMLVDDTQVLHIAVDAYIPDLPLIVFKSIGEVDFLQAYIISL